MAANWNNIGGGIWSYSGNWTDGEIPTSGANVTFALSPVSYISVVDVAYTQTGVSFPKLNSVNLQPHLTLDIQRSIIINALNNASGTESTATGGLVEVGNGAVVNYNVGDFNEASLYILTDGVGAQGEFLVDGPIDTGGTITLDGVNFDTTSGIVDPTAVVTLENSATYDAQASETFNLGTIKLAGGGVANLSALPSGALAFQGFSPTDQQVVMTASNDVLVLPHTVFSRREEL